MTPNRVIERARAWGPWVVFALPAALLATSVWAVAASYSPAPFWDQWGTVALWRDVVRGEAGPTDLFAQHNEHRIFFPRLVFLADFAWFKGGNLLNLAVIGAAQLAGAALYGVACDLRRPRIATLLAAAVAASLMFSLAQWENLSWGFQVQFVGVFAAGGWAIYLFCTALDRPEPERRRMLAGALALLVVATYSLSSGLLAGFAMVLAALVARRSARTVLGPLAATAVLLAAYLHGYEPVRGHSPVALALREPGLYAGYLLTYLGNPWGLGRVPLAMGIGLIGALATAAMGVATYRARGRDAVQTAMFGIALFIGMTAAVTAVGRLSFGLEQALSSRYVTPVAHFWAAQAVFWTLAAGGRPRPWAKAGVGLAIAAAGLALIPLQRWSGATLAAQAERVLAGSSALLADVDDPQAVGWLYPDPAVPRDLAPFLREQHLSLFAEESDLVRGAFLTRRIAGDSPCHGRLEVLTPAPESGQAWRAHGWGWTARTSGSLVLTDETGRILGAGLGGMPRHGLWDGIGGDHSGWIGSLARGAGSTVIAYGILEDGRACELGRAPWPAHITLARGSATSP